MIRFIHARLLQHKLEVGETPVLIDITSENSYEKLHPRNSINIPVRRLHDPKVARSYLPDPGHELILFAEDYENEPAWEAAELLVQQGYDNLYIYEGGKAKWVEEGLPFQALHYPPAPPEPGAAAVPPKSPGATVMSAPQRSGKVPRKRAAS